MSPAPATARPEDLIAAGATACAQAVNEGRASALALCEGAIGRIEAFDGGVYGHKPSVGVLPTRGHDFPGTEQEPSDRPGVIGPLARTADDLALALEVLAGPEVPDATAWALQWPAPRHAALRDFRVLVLTEHPVAECADEMRAALEALAQRLEQTGARVARQGPWLPDLQSLSKEYGAFINTALSAFEPDGRTGLSAHDWIRLLGRRDAFRVQWRRFFEQFDALLCPPFGCAAFPHQDAPEWDTRTLRINGHDTRFGAQGAWSTLASHAGLPATVAPLTRDAQGLPLGVQIIGPYLEDRTPIALARLLATA